MTDVRRVLAACSILLVAASASAAERLTLNFNPDWRFVRDDPPGAQEREFDDSRWILVSTPHTYNDVDTFVHWSTPGHRGEQLQWSGRTWYRKTFTPPAAWSGRRIFIEFEAARQVAEVYLNGERVGTSKTGFTPFGFDLTPRLRIGAANTIAVMVDNRFMKDPLDPATEAELARLYGNGSADARPASQPNPNLAQLQSDINKTIPDRLEDLRSDQIPWNNPHWHPAHGGLYRNVRLYITDPLHISLPLYSFLETTGPYAYAADITPASARVTVEVPVQNEGTAAVRAGLHVRVLDADGTVAMDLTETRRLQGGARAEFVVSGQLAHPRLWEPDYPHVYRVMMTLRAGGDVVDSTEVPLGIRAPRWDAAQGFFINGNHVKLHGWGQKPTDEWPALGAALPDWLTFYTLKLMKDAGGNFLRWGHCAAGPAQIAAADRLGLITDQPGVDGESDTVKAAWQLRTIAFRDTVVYFRNNPSILIWEGGNQKVTREHAQELRGIMDRYDPHGGRAYAHRRADTITAGFMDVGIGTEGGREIAMLPVVEGEYDREESPRRVWDKASPPNFGYPEAAGMTYQLTSEEYAVNQVAQYVKKLGAADHSGGANWIFSDSTSGGRVPAEVARAGGEVDGVRLPKEAYFVVAAMFRGDPQVHIIGHWSYPANTTKDVYVASNADAVELFVNGRPLGTGERSDRYLFTFRNVHFEPGEIKAVASTGGQVIATQTKRTAGPAVALKLTPLTAPGGLRADGSDIALIDVEAVDAAGQRVPTFQQRVDFRTEGPGVWRGGYNSGRIDSINHSFLDVEAGINRVAVRATNQPGAITVRARSAGLEPASVTVVANPFPVMNGFSVTPPASTPGPLPVRIPTHPSFTSSPVRSAPSTAGSAMMVGAFVQTINYTGPTASIIHVETGARPGRRIYVDREYTFGDLPPELTGADWIQLAWADQAYSAVDLIELAVKGGSVITVAHDAGLPVPPWLARQFTATHGTIAVNGRPMSLFTRAVSDDASLTLGSNTDGAAGDGAMYVVFVNAK